LVSYSREVDNDTAEKANGTFESVLMDVENYYFRSSHRGGKGRFRFHQACLARMSENPVLSKCALDKADVIQISAEKMDKMSEATRTHTQSLRHEQGAFPGSQVLGTTATTYIDAGDVSTEG
jgi:hypothetical protein